MNENHGNEHGNERGCEWHIVSRHFAKSIGSYTDTQIGYFFDVVNGRRLEPGCTQVFIGKSSSISKGVYIELGISNPHEGVNWWHRWDRGGNFNPGSHCFCLTDRMHEYIQDRHVAPFVEKRLTAHKTRTEQMEPMRLMLDLSAFEAQILETSGFPLFSEVFKAELVRHPAEGDVFHEYRVIGTVMTVFGKHPLLQPGARVAY